MRSISMLYPSILLAAIFPVCTDGYRSSPVQLALECWSSAKFLVCSASHASWWRRFSLLSPCTSNHFWALLWLLQLRECKCTCSEVCGEIPMGLNQTPPLKILPKTGLAKYLDLAKDIKNHNNFFCTDSGCHVSPCLSKLKAIVCRTSLNLTLQEFEQIVQAADHHKSLALYSLPYIFHHIQMRGKREHYCQNINSNSVWTELNHAVFKMPEITVVCVYSFYCISHFC